MKKKYVLKDWVKNTIALIVCGLLLALCCWLLSLTEKGNEDAINSCMAYGGSSYETCVRGVYGY